MLGAFEDGELEPHEMQDVAFHLARCDSCTGLLADFAAIGRELRSVAVAPALAGFADSVRSRIEKLPTPLGARIRRFFGRLGEELNSGIAIGGLAAATAVLTVFALTPYLRQNTGPKAPAVMASAPNLRAEARKIAGDTVRQGEDLAANAPDVDLASDSHAVISRLESEIPSVAVWSEPRTDTTVIWLPDQQ